MRNRPYFAVVFMFVLTAVCSFILIGLGTATRDRVQANQQLAFERAVLEVFGLARGGPREIHATFVERIIPPDDGDEAPVHMLRDGQNAAGYALPVEGQGFWAPIRGVVGFQTDRRTIRGIAFYEQNETPGLGGEIVKPYFRERFVGRVVQEADQPIRVRPAGSVLEANEVHAITGATQTCMRLERILNDDIRRWKSAGRGTGP